MINFVSFLMECGAFTGVRAQLKDLSALPKFADSKEATDFHTLAARAVDLEEPIEDAEVEAQKRLAAIIALNESGDPEAALDLMLQLEGKLKETQYFKSNQSVVQKQLQDIKRKLQNPKKKP
jgi:hypothetical protein